MSVMILGIVALPRTFVGFSSSNISYYRMMCAWKANEHIDFDFADFQLDDAINSENEYYISRSAEIKSAAPTPTLSLSAPTHISKRLS